MAKRPELAFPAAMRSPCPKLPEFRTLARAGFIALALLGPAAAQPAPTSDAAPPATVRESAAPAAASVARSEASVAPAPEPPPSWLIPTGEILGVNVGLWAWNRYIADYGFARISPATMAYNLRHSWVWDEDQFHINQFGHPYQGSYYFSSARYHGHDFYTSAAFTMFGSLQWEYFMEAESPSYNDLLTTTLGGAMLGEISFRLSNALLDPRAYGFERVARELGAAVVNPVNGLNRLASGETFRNTSRRTRPRLHRRDLVVRGSTGGVLPFFATAEDDERTDRHRLPRANTELLILYGNEFEARKPYDHFILNLGVNVIRQPVATVSARAQLASVEIYRSTRQRGQLLIGQNFDYIDNGIYKLGVSGLGGGYAHERVWGRNWFHTLHVQAGAIPLGGVSTEFFRKNLRDYNLGGGAFTHTRLLLGQRETWHVALVSDRYWLHTRSGAKGDEFIGHSRAEIAHTVWKSLGLAVSTGTYDRLAKTRDFGTRAEITQEARLLLTYGFH